MRNNKISNNQSTLENIAQQQAEQLAEQSRMYVQDKISNNQSTLQKIVQQQAEQLTEQSRMYLQLVAQVHADREKELSRLCERLEMEKQAHRRERLEMEGQMASLREELFDAICEFNRCISVFQILKQMSLSKEVAAIIDTIWARYAQDTNDYKDVHHEKV